MEVCEKASTPVLTLLQSPPVPRRIPGWALDQRFRPWTPTEAALLAVDLVRGVPIEPLSVVAAFSVTGTTAHYYNIAWSLSPAERDMVEVGGKTLTDIVRRRRAVKAISNVA
jgi:hypothetical protein